MLDHGVLQIESITHQFVIQEIEGKDLQNAQLTISQSIRVGLRILKSLESLHDIGYIHGDIKPNNILVTRGSQRKVTLIDFGLSTRYLDDKGQHVPNKTKFIDQNEWFASVNAFQNNTLSRRDDIICLVYSMVFFYTGYRRIQQYAPTEYQIGGFKLSASPALFCEGCEFLAPVLEEAYSLKFDEKPNYNKLKFLLKNTLIDRLQTPSSNFHWGNDFSDEEELSLDPDEKVSNIRVKLPQSNIEIMHQHKKQFVLSKKVIRMLF